MNTEISIDQPESSVKSRPVYKRLCADDAAREHVLVAESLGQEAVLRVVDAVVDKGLPVEVYWFGPVPEWLSARVPVHAFDSIGLLGEALTKRLSSAAMGLRLYLAGREAFIWQVNLVTIELGLREDEIQREACGSRARRVFCVHCRHLIEDVGTNPTPCPKCDVLLEVRDHFSRALAAYIGVAINAEDLNDRPEPQALFT